MANSGDNNFILNLGVKVDENSLKSELKKLNNKEEITVKVKLEVSNSDSGKSIVSKINKEVERVERGLKTHFFEKQFEGAVSGFNKLGNASDSLKTDVEHLKKSFYELQNILSIGDNQKIVSQFKDFENILKSVSNQVGILNRKNKDVFSLRDKRDNLLFHANKILNNISTPSKFRKEIKKIIKDINKLDKKDNKLNLDELNGIQDRLNKIKHNIDIESGTLFGKLRSQAEKFGLYLGVSTAVLKVQQALKDMVVEVYKVDKALTELYRVTDLSATGYNNLYDSMTISAQKYGATLDSIILSTANWAKLGFDATTSNKLAEISAMYQHVTGLDEKTAVKNLVTAYKGYEDELLKLTNGDKIRAVEYVADILNKIGNEFAINSEELGAGIANSASALQVAGNTIQQTSGMITGLAEVTQNAERGATALRVTSLRLRGIKLKELQEMGEDTDGLIEDVTKLEKHIRSLSGVKITDLNGQFRSTYDIFRDLAGVWDKLDGNSQSSILEAIAGKNRASDVAALIKNWENVEKATISATNAQGSASREHQVYLDSIEGKLNTLKATWQVFSNTVINSGLIKGGVDGLTAIVKGLDTISGYLPSLIISATTFFAIFKTNQAKTSILELYNKVGGLEGVFKKVKDGWKSTWSAIAKHPIATAIGIGSLVVSGLAAWKQHQENIKRELRRKAEEHKENSEKELQKVESLDSLIERYKELKKANQNDKATREGIIQVQKELNELVGGQEYNVDLVNGKLEEQLDIYKKIREESKERARNEAELSFINSHELNKPKDFSEGSKIFGIDIDIFEGNTLYEGYISDKLKKVLNKSKFGDYLQYNDSKGTWSIEADVDLNGNKIATAIQQAKLLSQILDYIENNYSDFAIDPTVATLKENYRQLADKIEPYKKSTSDFIKNIVSGYLVEKNIQYDFADTKEGYEQFKKFIIDKARNDNKLKGAFSSDVLNEKEQNDIIVNVIEATQGLFTQAREANAKSNQSSAFSLDLENEIKYINEFNNAIKASNSGVGLSLEQISKIKGYYSDLEGYNPSALFEKTANGIHLNVDELTKLDVAYRNVKKSDISNELNKLKKEYIETSDKLKTLTKDTREYNETLAKKSGLEKQIENVEKLATGYDGATSAFNRWKNATDEDSDGYINDRITKGFERAKELYDDRKIGSLEFKSFVDLVSYKSTIGLSPQENKAIFDSFSNQLIDGTNFKIADFIGDTEKEAYNLLKAINQINSDWAKMDEHGNWLVNLSDVGDRKVAERLGVDIEFLHSKLLKLSEFGADVKLNASVDDSKVSEFENKEHKANGEITYYNVLANPLTSKDLLKQGVLEWLNNIKNILDFKSKPLEHIGIIKWLQVIVGGNKPNRFIPKSDPNERAKGIPDVTYFESAAHNSTLKQGSILKTDKNTSWIDYGTNDKKNYDTSKKKKTSSSETKDKFKDWLSSLFDWIEIKIKRHTEKIDNYLQEAKFLSDNKKYAPASKNYQKAITTILSKIDLESLAEDKYNKQADLVLNKAVSLGKIDSKVANEIKTSVANGKLNISKYSDGVRDVISAYSNWISKAKEANKIIIELHNNARTYIKDLREMRDAQRQNRTFVSEKINDTIQNLFVSTPQQKGGNLDFVNTLLKNKNESYSKAVKDFSGDVISIGKKNVGSIKSASAKAKGKYKKALKNALSAIKSKKKISDGDMKVIGSKNTKLYNSLFTYNVAYENLTELKLEQTIDYAKNSSEILKNISEKYKNYKEDNEARIGLFRQYSSNSNSYQEANSYLDKAGVRYDKILDNSEKGLKEFNSILNKNKSSLLRLSKKSYKNLGSLYDKIKSAISSGKSLSPSLLNELEKLYSSGKISDKLFFACLNYNNSVQYKKEAKLQNDILKQTVTQEKESLATEKFNNVKNHFENLISSHSSETENLRKDHAHKTTRGLSLTLGDYNRLISRNQGEQTLYLQAISELNARINQNLGKKNGWTTASAEYHNALRQISEYELRIKDTIIAQEEYNNAIAQLPYQELEKALALLDSIKSLYESDSDLKNKLGKDLSEEDYFRQMRNNNEKIGKFSSESAQAYSDYLKALGNYDRVYGGKTAEEWLAIYHKSNTEINNLRSANEDLKDALRDDVYWRTFERAHKSAKQFAEVLDKIDALISDDMLLDKNGKFTEFGISHIANLTKKYETARNEVQNYSNDIQNLHKLYMQGYYTQSEYTDKLNELQKGMLDSANEMKSSIGDITNSYKSLAQAELDSLFELIEARRDALQSKRDYYSFDSTIKTKTKDIQALKAQIAALEEVETAEAKASKVRLNSRLSDSEKELDDIMREHSFKLSQDTLSELKDTLKEAFDDKWNYINSNLKEISELMSIANELTRGNTYIIGNSLTKLLSHYGIQTTNNGLSRFTGYAKGSRGIDRNKLAWTNENGREIIVRPSDGAILTPLKRGDIIPNADLSKNLFEWGRVNPDAFKNDIVKKIPHASINKTSTIINQSYGSLLNVEGNVDKNALPKLQDILQKSYEFTTAKIVSDARKVGIKV